MSIMLGKCLTYATNYGIMYILNEPKGNTNEKHYYKF